MVEIRRILCPIDFSDFSRRALDHAVAIARWYESTVTVLHVFSPVPVAAFGPGPVSFEPIVLTAADREQLLADTKEFAAAESAPGIAIEAVLREGNTSVEILDQATSMDADLLVIGTHGRSGFERLVLGSVAEKVLRKARCPVLTVPRAASRRRSFRPGSFQTNPLRRGLLRVFDARVEVCVVPGTRSRWMLDSRPRVGAGVRRPDWDRRRTRQPCRPPAPTRRRSASAAREGGASRMREPTARPNRYSCAASHGGRSCRSPRTVRPS